MRGRASLTPTTQPRPKIAAALGRRVREVRLEQGLTQEALAGLAGLHATFISNVERGYTGV
jgi:DNA-binding XRE family transcriptional regulator